MTDNPSTPKPDYEELRDQADRLEMLLKEELLHVAVLHAEEAHRSLQEIRSLPRETRLTDKKVRRRIKAAGKVYQHLRDLLRS